MSEKTAKLVKAGLGKFTGHANLYKLSEPVSYGHDEGKNVTDFVVVSATVVGYGSGPETYIFPADENGEIIDWGELEGSFKGELDHNKALSRMGFSVEI
jgi:hypothetical protein